MRRHYWLIGALTIAATLANFSTSPAQNVQCCTYDVTHHFRFCLPRGCQPQVRWQWNTQAAAWDLNNLPPTINTNNGSALYNIPSTDTQCASAFVGQDCAFSTACASFSVNWILGTNCVQGQHRAYGRACVRCRRHGANAQSSSYIEIGCAINQVQWAPQFRDQVGGGCQTEIIDPVYAHLRNPATGETRRELLFDLTASGLNWDAQDTNGDGWPDAARIRGNDRPPRGHVTLLKRTAGPQGGDSRLHIRFENGTVTESEATGEFENLPIPQAGDPMPGPDDEGIEVPAEFRLPVDVPSGWEIAGIQMGGGGESGDPIPVPGDVDGNGCVDDADLLQVLFAFGSQGGNADVNGDGIVDDADLLIVLFNFGAGC